MAEIRYAGRVPQRRQEQADVNAIIASLLGWSLDLFDLFILLYVAPVIGALFFPASNADAFARRRYALIRGDAADAPDRFGGVRTFCRRARPQGRDAGRHHRRRNQHGGVRPAADHRPGRHDRAGHLPGAALVQGVFVGGVVASTHTIGTELVPARWRGAMSGLVGGGGAGIGALLASFIFLITSSIFPGDAFAVWGWRFMFFSGLLSSLLGWFIFRNLEELPYFKEQQRQQGASRRRRRHRRSRRCSRASIAMCC